MPSRPTMNSQSAQAGAGPGVEGRLEGADGDVAEEALGGRAAVDPGPGGRGGVAEPEGLVQERPQELEPEHHAEDREEFGRAGGDDRSRRGLGLGCARAEPSSRTDSRMAMTCLLVCLFSVSSVAVPPGLGMGRKAPNPRASPASLVPHPAQAAASAPTRTVSVPCSVCGLRVSLADPRGVRPARTHGAASRPSSSAPGPWPGGL